MPNWYRNNLCVKGCHEDLKAFVNRAMGATMRPQSCAPGGKTFCLSGICPPPKFLAWGAYRTEFFSKQLTKWRLRHWGISYDPFYDGELRTAEGMGWSEQATEIRCGYTTTGGDSRGLVKLLGERFPKLVFELEYYIDIVVGRFTMAGGRPILDEVYRPMLDDDETGKFHLITAEFNALQEDCYIFLSREKAIHAFEALTGLSWDQIADGQYHYPDGKNKWYYRILLDCAPSDDIDFTKSATGASEGGSTDGSKHE